MKQSTTKLLALLVAQAENDDTVQVKQTFWKQLVRWLLFNSTLYHHHFGHATTIA